MAATAEQQQTLTVGIFSWNVGNTAPPADLSDWFAGKDTTEYGIIAIGVQECYFKKKKEDGDAGSPSGKRSLLGSLPLIGKSVELHKKIHGLEFWKVVEERLNEDYKLLESKRRLEMELRVYARRPLIDQISKVKVANEATGLGGVVGNKGGIAISLRFHGVSLCFLSAHMAAHQEKVDQRRANYVEICSNLRGVGRRNFELTNQFDYLFWFGDLNYRIDLPFATALALAENPTPEAWDELYRHDQLRKEIEADQCFHFFTAAVPHFPPTYRMKKGVSPAAYNHELERVPSWCDRVLVSTSPNPALSATLLEFQSVPSITSSDHSPVRAVYSLRLRAPDFFLDKIPKKRRGFRRRRYQAEVAAAQLSSSLLPMPSDLKTTEGPEDHHHPAEAAEGDEEEEEDADSLAAGLVLVLTELKGRALLASDRNGFSDPFLRFSSPGLLAKKKSTAVISRTLDPDWSDTIEIPFYPSLALSTIQQGDLFVEVLDKDPGLSIDEMGQLRIPLSVALATPTPFIVPVVHSGKKIGTISGLLTIKQK